MSIAQFTTASVSTTTSETSALVRTCARIAGICFNAESFQPGRNTGNLFKACRDAAMARDCDAMRAAIAQWEQKRPLTRARLALVADATAREHAEGMAEIGVPMGPSIEAQIIGSPVSLDAYRAQRTAGEMR